MLAEESHTPSQSIVCKDENNIETINSPGPLKIVNIKSLTNQEREDTEAGDMEVDSITTSSAFKIVCPGSLGKMFLASRLSGCKKSAVKRLSVTDRQTDRLSTYHLRSKYKIMTQKRYAKYTPLSNKQYSL